MAPTHRPSSDSETFIQSGYHFVGLKKVLLGKTFDTFSFFLRFQATKSVPFVADMPGRQIGQR